MRAGGVGEDGPGVSCGGGGWWRWKRRKRASQFFFLKRNCFFPSPLTQKKKKHNAPATAEMNGLRAMIVPICTDDSPLSER